MGWGCAIAKQQFGLIRGRISHVVLVVPIALVKLIRLIRKKSKFFSKEKSLG